MSDTVITEVKDRIDQHINDTGKLPESVSVSPIVYKLLDKEARKLTRYGTVPDDHEGMNLSGVRIELDDDLQAVVVQDE